MPPQNQVPGEDVLLDTLRRSKITDDQRQQLWDAYHTPGDENAFVGSLNKLKLPDDAKQTLYDMRYKGFKNLPTNSQAVQPIAPQGPVQGGDSIMSPDNRVPWVNQYKSLVSRGVKPAIANQVVASLGETDEAARLANEPLTGIQKAGQLVNAPNRFIDEKISGPATSFVEKQLQTPVGKEAASGLGAAFYGPPALAVQAVSRILPKQSPTKQAADTFFSGSGHDIATLGTAFATDPKNWPFLLAGSPEVEPVLKATTNTLFTAMQQKGAIDAVRSGDYQNAAINQGFALLGMSGIPSEVKEVYLNHLKAQAQLQIPTQSGPSTTRQASQLSVEFSKNPPAEARATTVVPTPSEGPQRSVHFEQGVGEANTGAPTFRDGNPPPIIAPKPLTYKSEAVGAVAGLDSKNPQRMADGLRAENYDLNDRLKGISDEFGALITGRIDENNRMIAELEAHARPDVPKQSPVKPEVQSGSTVDIPSLIKDAGLIDKGELVKGSGIYQVEHPDHPNGTMAVRAGEISNVEDLKGRMADKLEAFAAKPPSPVPGAADLNVSRLKENADILRGKTPEVLPDISATSSVPVNVDLPNQLRFRLETLPEAERQVRDAPNDAQRAQASKRLKNLQDQVDVLTHRHLSSLDSEQLTQLKGKLSDESTTLNKQAGVVDTVRKTDTVAKSMREEMRGGTPAKSIAGGHTIINSTHADIRQVLHELMGDETAMKFDEVAIEQRARLRQQGVDPEFALPKGYRRLAPEEFEIIREDAKRELGEIQATLKSKVKDIVSDLAEKNPSKVLELGEDTFIKSAEAKSLVRLLSEQDETGKTVKDQVSELRQIIGRDPQRPVYAKKGAPIEEAGVIKPAGEIGEKSLDLANRIWGRKLNKIPDDAAWSQKATELRTKGTLLDRISAAIDKTLKVKPPKGSSEAGVVGEASKPTAKSLSDSELFEKAKELGYKTYTPTIDRPAGNRGWLSADGKKWVEVPVNKEHDTVAFQMLGAKDEGTFTSYTDKLLKQGWIRKANYYAYQADRLTPRNVGTIETDAIGNNRFSKEITLEQITTDGRYEHFDIPNGWENLKEAFGREMRAQRATSTPLGESGRIGGIEPLIGGTAGALAGAKIGGAVGGPVGAAVGAGTGFVVGTAVPALLRSQVVRNSMRTMAPLLRNAGVSIKSFFQGPPQLAFKNISPDMGQIIEEQKIHLNHTSDWIERAKQLPAQIYKGFDPFAYVADSKNLSVLGKVLMSFDKSGQVFRDLRVPDTQSLYVALRNAKGEALGQRAFQGMQYADIKTDAAKAGLGEMLSGYLNLKGYQRVHDVLNEHVQELQKQSQDIQQQLQNPGNTVRENVHLQDQLKEVNKLQKDIQDRVAQGQATPKGYTPQKIASEMQNMQQQLGPQGFKEVEDLATRAFDSRRNILDMLHSNGIISTEAYNTFKGRGTEYVPMERIMDDLELNKFSSAPSPLHLRHQTVIQTLEGSQRTNVDPFEAFANADRKAFNQMIRNDAMKSAVDLAANYPQTIGKEFTPVKAGYKPKAGEMLLGHYENGEPKLFAVPEYLGKTMEQLPGATKTALGAFANWYAHQFKRAATVGNIGFQISSLISHAMSSALLPEHGLKANIELPIEAAKFIKGWVSSVKEVLQKGPEYRDMVRSGAAFSSFQRTIDPEYFANPSDVGFVGKIAKGRILDAAQDLASGLEDVNKLNSFIRARQAGLASKQAAWEAKQFGGAPDFSRLGDLSQPLNQAFMFFNAANQYLHQATSAIRKDPMRVGGLMVAVTAATIALNQWNQQQNDSKGNSLLRKVTVNDRQRYWNVLTPWTYISQTGSEQPIGLKIPKPYIARLISNPVEDAVNYVSGKEVRTGTQQALDSISNVSPIHLNLREGDVTKSLISSAIGSLHPLAKTAIEQYSNIDEYGRPIVPQSQRNIAPEYQVNPGTSAVAREMGHGGTRGAKAGATLGGAIGSTFGLPGVGAGAIIGGLYGSTGPSPVRTDAAVRSLTATVGQSAEVFANPFFQGASASKQLHGTEALRDIPVVGPAAGRFLTSPSDAEESTLSSQFYKKVNDAQTVLATFERLKKENPQEASSYVQTHKNDLAMGRMSQNMIQRVGQINSLQKNLQMNQSIPEDARMEALKNLHDAKIQILRQFNQALDTVQNTSNANPAQPWGGTQH